MRLEHHLVGGYVRYISPHIIIIIIITATQIKLFRRKIGTSSVLNQVSLQIIILPFGVDYQLYNLTLNLFVCSINTVFFQVKIYLRNDFK